MGSSVAQVRVNQKLNLKMDVGAVTFPKCTDSVVCPFGVTGEDVSVTVKVTNEANSEEDAGPFDVTMKLVDTSSSTESDVVGSSHTISYGGLLINGSTPDDTYTIKMPSTKGTAYKLKVKIDSGNKIYESDETDNGWVSTDFPTHVRPTVTTSTPTKTSNSISLSGVCTNSEASGATGYPTLDGDWSISDNPGNVVCNLASTSSNNNLPKKNSPDTVTDSCSSVTGTGNVTFKLTCRSTVDIGNSTTKALEESASVTIHFP